MRLSSITLALILAFGCGLAVGSARKERASAPQLPERLRPTEFRVSMPLDEAGQGRTTKTLRVRASDPNEAERLWVVYLVVGDEVYSHTCEAIK